jgi:putative tricarboxylic transport membrane protein
VVNRVSHEAITGTVTGLILVRIRAGGILGLFVTSTVGLVGGLLARTVRMHAGVQSMGYYLAVLTVPTLLTLV